MIPEYHSPKAEAACLGIVMVFPGRRHEVFSIAGPDDFFDKRHALIAETIQDIGDGADLITVTEKLRAGGRLADAGGAEYLSSLLDGGHSASYTTNYASIVRDKAVKRKIVGLANEIRAKVDEDAEGVLDFAQGEFLKIGNIATVKSFRKIGEVLRENVDHLIAIKKGGETVGVPSGMPSLDRMLGHFHPGNLIVIGGRPGMGKTALALTIVQNIVEKIPCGMFSLEMTAGEIVNRMITAETGIATQNIRNGTLSDYELTRFFEAAKRQKDLPFVIDDEVVSATGAFFKARQMVHAGAKIIIFDYLQLVDDQTQRRGESREQFISSASRGFKRMAKELNVPVVLLSQLSRKSEGRADRRPMLSDLRDSGAIEQDADQVLFVHQADEDSTVIGDAEILVRKNRHGMCGDISLRFDAVRTIFRDWHEGERAGMMPKAEARANGYQNYVSGKMSAANDQA